MRLRFLVLFVLMAVIVQAATTASPLAGRWHFVPEKSKGGQHFPPDTTLVVKQAGSRMYFEYWANNRIFQKDEYRTDGTSEKLYSNANETATVDARLLKNQLQITTHHLMESEIGSKSYNDTDSWVVSKDGSTLTFRSSDGNNLFFEREGAKPAAAAPTAAPKK
ncbi:MAG TPA: hypothetical protein VMS96_07310 [Terriglobales bacterium]|nr:hypothetical protein [Terriglobales bacterium]